MAAGNPCVPSRSYVLLRSTIWLRVKISILWWFYKRLCNKEAFVLYSDFLKYFLVAAFTMTSLIHLFITKIFSKIEKKIRKELHSINFMFNFYEIYLFIYRKI